MSKGLVAFIVVACIGFAASVIIFMKQSADDTRKRSDVIMEQFKQVDRSLRESHARVDSLNNSLPDSMNN